MKYNTVSKQVLHSLFALTLSTNLLAAPVPQSAVLDIQLSLPVIDEGSYERPYVAVWLEDDQKKPVTTMQLWVQDSDWYQDLRSWWRKIGRYENDQIDAYSSATRSSGNHRFRWKVQDAQKQPLSAGKYRLNIEVVREGGGRSYARQVIELTDTPFKSKMNTTELDELGDVTINYTVK